jgi:hypothetical protein
LIPGLDNGANSVAVVRLPYFLQDGDAECMAVSLPDPVGVHAPAKVDGAVDTVNSGNASLYAGAENPMRSPSPEHAHTER